MDSVETNQNEELVDPTEECTVETCADHLLSLGSADTDDIFGERQALPRVGDQYQVEIPSLMTESELLWMRHSAFDKEHMLGADYVIRVGLAIPVMWVQQVGDLIKHEREDFAGTTGNADKTGTLESINYIGSWIDPKFTNVSASHESSDNYESLPLGSTCKVEFPDDMVEHNKEFAAPKSTKFATSGEQTNFGLPRLQQNKDDGFCPLPGSPVNPWSDAESQSFLLGLYIFGKNLVQIRKFMEVKKMGDILSFYYGKFYRCDAYRRWSECRKIRSRRCIHGQRIFTGWRQQELLSRLLPGMSKEDQDTLLERSLQLGLHPTTSMSHSPLFLSPINDLRLPGSYIILLREGSTGQLLAGGLCSLGSSTRAFTEGRASLEEYVSTLKSLIGMQKLVSAVGIGKGKHDLTGIVLDPVRTTHVIPIRPEIPVGKACSSLTAGDIIKFLTGDFRLSKAKSNDLFWEAVWPRLLAKGWHSEQPLDLVSVGSKSTLVFLAPGIKKFSRKRLVKGNHYFDSVSDVLNKVASDPRLLELEIDGAKGDENTKEGLDGNMKLDQNDPSDHKRHRYLRPKLSNFHSELMKFTVVDTSLFHGQIPYKVRELRSLPADATPSYAPSSPSGRTDSDSSEEQPDSTNVASNAKGGPQPGTSINNKLKKEEESDLSDHLATVSKKRVMENGYGSNNSCHDLSNSNQPMYDLKSQHNHGVESSRPNYLSPVSKRQRLTACKHAGSGRRTYSFSRGHKLKKEESVCGWRSFKANENQDMEAGPSQGMRFTSLFAKYSPDESSNYFHTGALNVTAMSQEKEKPQPRFFDLNLPHFSPDIESNESTLAEAAGSQGDLNPKESSNTSGIKQQIDNFEAFETPDGVPSMEQPTTNSLRQSTRSRPLTTKALEAFACGFLSTGRRGRGTSNLTSRSSRRARRAARAPVPPLMNVGITNPNTMVPNVGLQEEYSSYTNHRNHAGIQEVYSNYANHTNHASMFYGSHVQSESKETHDLLGVP